MRALACVVAALLACACGEPESAPPGDASGSERFSVALLTPGSIADGGWNQGAYEGLKRIEKDLGAEISNAETKTPADFEEGFRDYASRGYDLVFGHGFEYQEAAATLYSVLAVGPGWDWTTLSSLYADPNVYTKQLRAAEAELKKRPEGTDINFVLAYHYLTMGSKDAATRRLKVLYKQMPEDRAAEAGEEVDVALAAGVPQVGALAARHDDRLAGVVPDQDLLAPLDQLLHVRHRDPTLPFRKGCRR